VDNERLKSVHRGYFKIDEASLRSLRLSMSGPVAFEEWRDAFINIFTITYWQIVSLLHTNMALLGVIQLLINFYS
jgi:hypothetical protein